MLDTGIFIGLENKDQRSVRILNEAHAKGLALVTSAGVVGQVWREDARQVPVAVVLKWPSTQVVDLTHRAARVIGKILAVSGAADVIDAHVALLARERDWPVVTSDVDDLRAIDPTLTLWQV